MSSQCIAMWSGPRNISTTMMRPWENHSDTDVIDGPFDAHFLKETGIDHPMADEVTATGNTGFAAAIEGLHTVPETGALCQKHITAHWMDDFPTDWLTSQKHVFLIREPARVVASYAIKRQDLTAFDLGYAQQAAPFDVVTNRQGAPPVAINSARFLENPESQLQSVCEYLELDFEDTMLNWPAGRRTSDGVGGAHWYDSVFTSTEFGPVNSKPLYLSGEQQQVVELCQPYVRGYESKHAITTMLNYNLSAPRVRNYWRCR